MFLARCSARFIMIFKRIIAKEVETTFPRSLIIQSVIRLFFTPTTYRSFISQIRPFVKSKENITAMTRSERNFLHVPCDSHFVFICRTGTNGNVQPVRAGKGSILRRCGLSRHSRFIQRGRVGDHPGRFSFQDRLHSVERQMGWTTRQRRWETELRCLPERGRSG